MVILKKIKERKLKVKKRIYFKLNYWMTILYIYTIILK